MNVGIIKSLLVLGAKNIGGMLLTKQTVVWAVRTLPKLSKTKVDDNIGLIVEGALNNDINMVLKAAEAIITELKGTKPVDAQKSS